jgi:hypothetical protein
MTRRTPPELPADSSHSAHLSSSQNHCVCCLSSRLPSPGNSTHFCYCEQRLGEDDVPRNLKLRLDLPATPCLPSSCRDNGYTGSTDCASLGKDVLDSVVSLPYMKLISHQIRDGLLTMMCSRARGLKKEKSLRSSTTTGVVL